MALLGGRGPCDKCGRPIRVNQFHFPWNKAAGYVCKSCADDELKQRQHERERQTKKDEMDHDYRCHKLDAEARKAEMPHDYRRRQEDAERQKAKFHHHYQTQPQPQPGRSNVKLELIKGDNIMRFEGHPDDALKLFGHQGKHQYIEGPPP